MPVGSNRTDHDAVLKDFYLGGAREVLNNQIFLFSQLETNTQDVEGREAVLDLNISRNQGVGSRQELADLPDAGRQGHVNVRTKLRYHYLRIQLSGQVIRDTKSDSGSFTREVTSEMNGGVRDLKNDINRQCYGDGTGAIALASGAAAGNVIPLANMSKQTIAQLGIGMLIDIGATAAAPTGLGSRLPITAIDRTAKTITVGASLGGTALGVLTATSRITRSGSGGTGATQSELTGLKAQVAATGPLFGVDPAVQPDWASTVIPGGPVAESFFIEGEQEVNMASGEQLSLWITTAAIHRKVAALMQSNKRFPGTTELRGGYTALDVSSVMQGNTGSETVALTFDKDMTEDGVAYGLTTSRFMVYSNSDWEWMQEDGAVLNRVPNKDAYEATLFAYKELGTDGRNAHCKITGLT